MSLLAPFGFGQKHAYFHVELTIHELTNVPLVTGLFACKWKVKGSHSLASLQHSAAAAVHQQTSRVISSTSRKHDETPKKEASGSSSSSHPAKDIHATDHDSGASNTLALGAPHEHQHRQASGSISADSASIISEASKAPSQHGLHKPAFLNNLLHHKDQGHNKAENDSHSGTPTQASDLASETSGVPSTAAEETDDSSTSPTDSRRDSTSTRKTTASRSKSILDFGRQKSTDAEKHNVDPLLFFTQEPKGETDFIKVHEHKVEWERDLQVGLRVGIGKPKTGNDTPPSSSRRDSPSVSAKSSAKDLRSRAHRDQHLEDMSTAWGRLTNSELKLTIKQDMPENVKSTTHENGLGYVVLDLSEFAPDPPSSSSRHRHHHHHHQHHHSHHHHHHPHVPGSEHSYRDRVSRTETRKFLLNDSKTNATVKITITMTFLGGAREYYVPPISNGLLVNGLGSIVAPSLLDGPSSPERPTASGGASIKSKSGSSDDASLHNEPIRATAHIRNRKLVGQGLPSASSLSLGNGSMYSHHNYHGPPLTAIYAKKTWTSRIPAENLVAGTSGSDHAKKKKPQRAPETSVFSTRNQADRAPDDVVDAIFKGIPVGGSHNGQMRDEAASKAAAARAQRADRAALLDDTQPKQARLKESKSPEDRRRVRTISSASSLSKKSERSFSFSLYRSKEKEKEKKEELQKRRAKTTTLVLEKDTSKSKSKTGSKESAKSGSSAELDSLAGDKGSKTHLSVPGSGKLTPGLLVESPSASMEQLPRFSSDAKVPSTGPSNARTATKRNSSVRWNLGDEAGTTTTPSQPTTPNAATMNMNTDKEQRDRAAMPPPPSVVVVDHAFIPIRAGGILAASPSAHNEKESSIDSAAGLAPHTPTTQGSGDSYLSPHPNAISAHQPAASKDTDAASIRSFSSATSTQLGGEEKRKISSNDLKGLYQAGLSIPESLSTGNSVGLDRLKKTGRAGGQFAKDKDRPPSRPNSSSGTLSFHDSQGVSGRERRSKGNRGVEPSEAESKGWHGAGWLRPISTAPAPLPPSPDLSSSSGSEDEFEDADGMFDSVTLRDSDERRSSGTDQTAASDAAEPSSPPWKVGLMEEPRWKRPVASYPETEGPHEPLPKWIAGYPI